MTDTVNGTSPADDDDLFEDSSDDFASKFDLAGRLVFVYPNGRTGQRMGENGKPYTWYETTTIVLDDGPDGWQPQVMNYETMTMQANKVPAVAEEGTQVLHNFQWSAGGFRLRLEHKVPAENEGVPIGLLGRVDVKPIKGKAPAWRPNPPTEADRAIALGAEVKALRIKERDAIIAALKAAEVEDAF